VGPAARSPLTSRRGALEALLVGLVALVVAGGLILFGNPDLLGDQNVYNLLVAKKLAPELFTRDALYRHDPDLGALPYAVPFFSGREGGGAPAEVCAALDYRFPYLLYPFGVAPNAVLSVAFHMALPLAAWLWWRRRGAANPILTPLTPVVGVVLLPWYALEQERAACRAAGGRGCWFALARRLGADYAVLDPGLAAAASPPPPDFERVWAQAGGSISRRRPAA
jgi:hypothetical protein